MYQTTNKRIETDTYMHSQNTLKRVRIHAGPGPHEAAMLAIQKQNEYELAHFGSQNTIETKTETITDSSSLQRSVSSDEGPESRSKNAAEYVSLSAL